MDKYEYKVRADEIKALIAEGEFAEAVKIADTIDWRRVRSVMMLCTVSDLYKINRRYQESKDILLLAYEKHPTGRLIVYSLCELSIKMGEYVQAIEYYKEFVQIAPKDTGRYILQYRLYEAQDVSLEERIAVLEEFKKRDYREKWAYELAYLYHRIGLSTKCVEECDEMFLWFGEGKYVIKALELKALHEPLNADQQSKYDAWMQERDAEAEEETEESEAEQEEDVSGDTQVAGEIRHLNEEEQTLEEPPTSAPTMELPEVKTVDVGQYNTINLQMALAESMKEILAEEEPVNEEEPIAEQAAPEAAAAEEAAEETDDTTDETAETEALQEEDSVEEVTAEEETFDGEEETENEPSVAEAIIAPLLQETEKLPDSNEVESALKETPVVPFPAKTEETAKDTVSVKPSAMETDDLQEIGEQAPKQEIPAAFDAQQIMQQIRQEMVKPSAYDNILSQEYDGQISLVVPDAERVEKQITGQLSIDDIMAEWEEMKKSNEQKRMEDVRQHIMAQTGSLFANFDEATKNGLLEELEKAFMAAIMKESKKPAIKKVILPEDVSEEETQGKGAAKYSEEPIQEDASDAVEDTDEVEELEEIEEQDAALEEEAQETAPVKKSKSKEEDSEPETENAELGRDRELTEEEKELFGQFVHHRKSKRQLVHTLDNMSLAACTGNVVITGEEEITTLTLAKTLIREMQYNDNNFSGKVAKISGNILNKKDVAATFAKLDNGALIIEKAAAMKAETVKKMIKVLEKDNMGLLLLMTDTKQKMNQFLTDHAALTNNFNLRVDIEPLDDEALVAYARQYAEEMEYAIDEFGILALHTRISEKQTSDHEVSLAEVRELVDEAIYYANKKTPGHFMDILFAKRYDEDDMIILREKDFMHYKN